MLDHPDRDRAVRERFQTRSERPYIHVDDPGVNVRERAAFRLMRDRHRINRLTGLREIDQHTEQEPERRPLEMLGSEA